MASFVSLFEGLTYPGKIADSHPCCGPALACFDHGLLPVRTGPGRPLAWLRLGHDLHLVPARTGPSARFPDTVPAGPWLAPGQPQFRPALDAFSCLVWLARFPAAEMFALIALVRRESSRLLLEGHRPLHATVEKPLVFRCRKAPLTLRVMAGEYPSSPLG